MKVIELTKGFVCVISREDFRSVSRLKWHVHFSRGKGKKEGRPYARTTIRGKHIYLHRFLTNAPSSMHVDHMNGQTLDCRRGNLEIVTHEENQKRRATRKESRKASKKG